MKLHLGCGKRDLGKGWVHIDKGDYPHLHSHNIEKLPFEDGSCSDIYASHVLEYFDGEQVVDVLTEWYRVLDVNGVLRIAVPDFDSMAYLYLNGKYGAKTDLMAFIVHYTVK